jgi:hypothetical protein
LLVILLLFQKENLQIWPRNGIMLGGQEVNITGPCFNDKYHFLCKWGDGYDAVVTPGEVVHLYSNLSTIKGRCVQPKLFYNGRLNLSISLDGGITFDWKSEFNIGMLLLLLYCCMRKNF